MKKILTILTTIGIASIVSGCSSMEIKKDRFVENFNDFHSNFNRFAKIEDASVVTQKALNKYAITLNSNANIDLVESTTSKQLAEDTQKNSSLETNQAKGINDDKCDSDECNNSVNTDLKVEEPLQAIEEISNQMDKVEPLIENEELVEHEEIINPDDSVDETNEDDYEESEEISTLYNLTADIDDSCDEFCELKKQITDAIIETEDLIERLQNKEIELTREQRMFINEQSLQLKNLGKQLSNITTELSISLSDLNQILTDNGHNINDLNLKYLIVLDNLVNGNEMLQSGLSSINLINQMFNLQPAIAGNNPNRILYGFQNNNEPPVYKNYQLDENGNLVEKEISEDKMQSDTTVNNPTQNDEKKETDNQNIDSYKSNLLETNIDGYYNNMNNIDSFFNTALLDNQFMYGNRGGFPYYNNMYYGFNPNYNQGGRTINGVDDNKTTEYIEQEKEVSAPKEKQPLAKKKIKLTKNIDTYKDANEPTLKEKFAKMKSFFKFNSDFN